MLAIWLGHALFIDLDSSDGNPCAGNTLAGHAWETPHLDSLAADPPLRPAQVGLSRVDHCTIVCVAGFCWGDFNAFQRFDRTLHVET